MSDFKPKASQEASTTSISEKAVAELYERPVPSDDNLPTFSETRTKALLRKMDWNIVPFLSLLYL